MKKLLLTLLLSYLTATVYADGNYGCVMNVSGGFIWENGTWKLTEFSKQNILIRVQQNGTLLQLKYASDTFEFRYSCSTINFPSENTNFLSCHGNGLIEFDEVNLKGGLAKVGGFVQRNNKKRDSLSVTEFTCQKF